MAFSESSRKRAALTLVRIWVVARPNRIWKAIHADSSHGTQHQNQKTAVPIPVFAASMAVARHNDPRKASTVRVRVSNASGGISGTGVRVVGILCSFNRRGWQESA